MKKIFLLFAEYIKNEVLTMSKDKYFVFDCLKFNLSFFDSLDECIKCAWDNKLIIDIPTIQRMSVEEVAIHIEMNVNMYSSKRMEDLIKKIENKKV